MADCSPLHRSSSCVVILEPPSSRSLPARRREDRPANYALLEPRLLGCAFTSFRLSSRESGGGGGNSFHFRLGSW